MENISSEQQLKQLLDEDKISRDEYEQLLSVMNKESNQGKEKLSTNEPEFKSFRIRVLTGSMVICIFGLPIGLYLNLPYVWILSIAGLAAGGIKLSRIQGSWLSKLLNRQN